MCSSLREVGDDDEGKGNKCADNHDVVDDYGINDEGDNDDDNDDFDGEDDDDADDRLWLRRMKKCRSASLESHQTPPPIADERHRPHATGPTPPALRHRPYATGAVNRYHSSLSSLLL